MKLGTFTSMILIAWTQVAVAQDKAATPAVKTTPCSAVLNACKAAGYVQGGHKDGKGLHADCVGKLFKGETVPGVAATPEQIKACQDRHGQIDASMMKGGKAMPPAKGANPH